ncbi:hypothetical protein ACRE_007920 [Hapsidospora chrysogenum ATCC 11550]|uniref:Uncharacterized protein n=1 Tax=Hapsidospora chrysogenum (strain ATCC 11550 / CBS 779.69 / DSM 880 / IAM 14645 / JCM 23072 / IMI 49137) TaxID=857340 RepID=A0A086TFY4_HAPC1|nr:hypothetical protein ACRE_007920 [Hapsidospora chrysogenum ATCC 11550]
MLPARNLALLSTMRTAGRPAVMGRGFFLSTSARLGLKESANLNRVRDRLTFDEPSADSVDFEQRKKDSLAKQKQGKGQWDPELASDSEEAVKADRGEGGEGDTSVLQDKTKKVAEESARKDESVRGDL